jgi:hypothetical protein
MRVLVGRRPSLAGLAFATWLEDADIPARVIDELMGHETHCWNSPLAAGTLHWSFGP